MIRDSLVGHSLARYRRMLRALVVPIIGMAAVLGVVAPASAATAAPAIPLVSCSGYTCHGHDPFVYNCSKESSTSVPVYYNGTQLATLVNWYGHCNGNWSQGQLTSAGHSAGDSFIIDISTTDSRGNFEYMCYPGPNNTGALDEYCSGSTYGGSAVAWTDMVDGTHITYSDIYVYNRSGTFLAQAVTSQ